MNRTISNFSICWLLLIVVLLGPGKVFADDFDDSAPEPESSKNSVLTYSHGLTTMGPRGLISIPTPEATGKERVLAGYKVFGRQKSSYRLQGVDYRQQIEESVSQLVIPTSDDAELVVSRWTRERSTTPDRLGLSHKDEILSFGGKFSGAIEERADFCLGIQWAAENDAALANSDLETLAQMRAVYLTTGCEVAPYLYGCAHVRQCYIPELRVLLNDNSEVVRKRELFSQAAFGLERVFGRRQNVSVIAELIYTSYPDIYLLDASRWQSNFALRGQFAGFNLELGCLSASFLPRFSGGISLSY